MSCVVAGYGIAPPDAAPPTSSPPPPYPACPYPAQPYPPSPYPPNPASTAPYPPPTSPAPPYPYQWVGKCIYGLLRIIWDVCLSSVSGVFFHNCWQTMQLQEALELILDPIFSIEYQHNDAQWYKQFLQVGRLYRALILLGFAPYLPSSFVSLVFMVLYIPVFKFFLKFFTLPLVSWTWWDCPLIWLTAHWPCWFGHTTCKIVRKMAYNMSSGILTPTILILYFVVLNRVGLLPTDQLLIASPLSAWFYKQDMSTENRPG